jgi:hypothetical protein
VDKPDPDADASEQDEAEKTGRCLVVAGCDAAMVLEFVEEALDASA